MKWVYRAMLAVVVLSTTAVYLLNSGYIETSLITDTSERGSSRIHYDWTVTKQAMSPDGVEKEMVVVNGMFPGPLIEGKVGDTITVNVHNSLDESTSVHWHGLRQYGNNAMDGAPGITQCGIPPGHNLTYEFRLEKPGTFWWHSHSHHQRVEGMFGGLIVHDAKPEKIAYDEVVVLLSDQYFDSGDNVMSWYMSRRSQGFEPVPDNGLINGQNVFDCGRMLNDKHKCEETSGKHAEFDLGRKKYRLRIINASALANYQFSIDELELKVVEADSTAVEPVNVHYLPIASGQRYSVIIDGSQAKSKEVFMRAEMNEECFNYPNLVLDSQVKGVVRFGGVVERLKDLRRVRSIPTSKPWKDTLPPNVCLDLDESLLKPVEKVDPPAGAADQTVMVQSKIMKLSRQDLKPYAFFNRTSWVPAVGAPNLHVELGHVNASESPAVSSVLGHPVTEKWGGDQMVINIGHNKVVDLIVNNNDESPHPFHLHGHEFYVMRIHNPDTMFGQWKPGDEAEYQTINPLRRDTVTIPRFGHAVLRFKADNPGIWAFHCHIHWHMMSGMVMQFAEAANLIDETIPQAMLDHCEIERN